MFFARVVGIEPTLSRGYRLTAGRITTLPHPSKEHYDCICASAQPLLPRATFRLIRGVLYQVSLPYAAALPLSYRPRDGPGGIRTHTFHSSV